MHTIYGYLRVSLTSQARRQTADGVDEIGASLLAQRDKIERYYAYRWGNDPNYRLVIITEGERAKCHHCGHTWLPHDDNTICPNCFRPFEGGLEYAGQTSAVNFRDRDGGARIWRSVVKGDHVCVASSSRAFRSTLDFCESVTYMNELGVGLHFLDHGLDTSTITGEGLAKIIAVVDEMERKRVSERTRESMLCQARQGRAFQPFASIGWKKNADGMLIVDRAQRDLIAEIMRLKYEEKFSDKMVCDLLNARGYRYQGQYGRGMRKYNVRRLQDLVHAAKHGYPRNGYQVTE